jgi:hypothetical protein
MSLSLTVEKITDWGRRGMTEGLSQPVEAENGQTRQTLHCSSTCKFFGEGESGSELGK